MARRSESLRRLFAVLERLEDRLVPSGFAPLSLATLIADAIPPGTIGVQDVRSPSNGGGQLEAPTSGLLAPVLSVGNLVGSATSTVLEVVDPVLEIQVAPGAAGTSGSRPGAAPGLSVDVPGIAALSAELPAVGQVLGDLGIGLGDPVGSILGTVVGIAGGGSGGAAATGGGTGLLGTGISVADSGVAVTLPLLSLGLDLGASSPSGPIGDPPPVQVPPSLPSVPGLPGGTGGNPGLPVVPTLSGGSVLPSSPAPPIGIAASPQTAGSSNPAGPTAAAIPGPLPLSGASPTGSNATTPASVEGIAVAQAPANASIEGSADSPIVAARSAPGDASATAAPPGQATISGPAQAAAAVRTEDDGARLEVAAVLPAPSPVVPDQGASLEVPPEVPASPAELLLRDLEGLETALGALLKRFDNLGEDLTAQLSQVGLLELLAALGMGGLAFEVLRRRDREKRREPLRGHPGSQNIPGPFYRPKGMPGSAGRGLFARGRATV